jgi:hypothetical protein
MRPPEHGIFHDGAQWKKKFYHDATETGKATPVS